MGIAIRKQPGRMKYTSTLHHNCRIVSDDRDFYIDLYTIWWIRSQWFWVKYASTLHHNCRIVSEISNLISSEEWITPPLCIIMAVLYRRAQNWWIQTMDYTSTLHHNCRIVSETSNFDTFLHDLMSPMKWNNIGTLHQICRIVCKNCFCDQFLH